MNPAGGSGGYYPQQQSQQPQQQQVRQPSLNYQQQSQQIYQAQQQQQQQQQQIQHQQQQSLAMATSMQQPQQGTPVQPQVQVQPQYQQQYQQTNMQQPQFQQSQQQPNQMMGTLQQPQQPQQLPNPPAGVPPQQPSNMETPQQQQQPTGNSSTGFKKFKGFFKQEQEGPNLGFKPTAAMAQRHEDALVSGKRPLFQFQVTKLRSWRTGYVRLLCLYDDHFSTFDPDSHQVTNTWNYDTLKDYMAIEKDQILLQVNADKLKFQCHNVERSMVLTSLLQCQEEHLMKSATQTPLVLCNRWTRHGTAIPSALKVTPYALIETHPNSKQKLRAYRFVDILTISFTSDDPSGIILYLKTKKTRLFSITSKSRSDIVTWMRQSYDRLGLELRMTDSSTIQQWKEKKREQQRKSEGVATEWKVTKQSRRHDSSVVGASSGWAGGVIARTLCITGTGMMLEKDSAGMIVSSRSLTELYALVRPSTAGDTLLLEYTDGQSRMYSSQSRDSLLVSLIDAATTLGRNPKVHVSDVTSGGYCLASFASSVLPEKSGGLFQPISIPLHCLKRVHAVATAAFSYMNSTTESSTQEGKPVNPIEECRNVMEVCREFNASVLPTAEGLPTGEKDKYVLGSIGALWGLIAELLEMKEDRYSAEQTAGPIFQTLHRLSKSAAGYKNSIELATFLDCIPLLWTIEDTFCKFWAFRTMTVLLSGFPPDKPRDKEVEYVNKSVIFKSGGPQLIQGLVSSLLSNDLSDLIRMVVSDILQSILCSFADTTSPEIFSGLIQALGEGYQALLGTLYQQTPFVIENSALLLHLLSTHAPQVATKIRASALSTAILLHHFHAAIFSPLEGQRFLSRFLCSLWLAGPMDCEEKKLLKRIVPRGFIGYLKMPLLSQEEEEQLDQLERDAVEDNIPEDSNDRPVAVIGSGNPSGAAGTNTARLRARIALARVTSKVQVEQRESPENFRVFFHVLTENHSLPDLIWNQQTRRELRIGLESEIQYIQRETEARGMHKIAWNYQQFGIDYPSLKDELRVGSVYMRLWLQAGEGFIKTWDEPLRLFELLFRRFLCEMDRDTKVTIMCIRCLERLYSIHGSTIGEFPDVMILIRSMVSTRSIETQHRLLGLLATLLGVQKDENGDENRANIPENAEQLLNTESISQLCHFVAWGHTNGVQVGNLMTSVLGSGYSHSGLAMITDGNQMRPAGKGREVETGSTPADSNCPAVWFIAATGRVPPPAESIKGPFRVSDLQRMMENGDLSPFTLVTSTHAEIYDDEEDPGSSDVREAHIDTGKWNRLDQVWQLRWQLCTDGGGFGIFSPSEVAIRAIRSVTRLVDLHKSLDSHGLPYYPIPIAKRIICGLTREPSKSGGDTTMHQDSYLSILTQSILCNDPRVVEEAAELLFKLTQYNEEATSKFYLTGVYFFISCYTGSNFKSLAKLLHATHLEQNFRSGFAAAADKSELSIKERSILGSMLPEGILFMLKNYGVDRFSEVFVGNYDTPEVIWSFEMRKHLIEMVLQHLGDFPKRLWQNTTAKYEYCPMPGVAYKRLEKEIFCHNYYLNNLCDEVRFPDWPIAEPVEVFRSCLEEFKNQMNRDETEEENAIENASKVLNLKAGDGSKELRRSYRTLARKYHPDKNPAGREMFESIQEAYELLLPFIESGQKIQTKFDEDAEGTIDDNGKQSNEIQVAEGFVGGIEQMESIQLLIKTQSLICRRFEAQMSKYKYPAYQILLGCLHLPSSSQEARLQGDTASIFRSSLMKSKRAHFVRDAVELLFRTCLVSPLNAEELVAESGVMILESLLDFYVHAASCLDERTVTSAGTASDSTVSEILSNVVHTLAGISYYESGRSAIANLNDRTRFCINWRRCLDGKYLGSKMRQVGDSLIKRYALEGVANMARSSDLQNSLIGAGVIWPLGRYLLGYDPTMEDGSIGTENVDDDIGMSQSASNSHARLAVRALGMLCGSLHEKTLSTPKNNDLQNAVNKMLTGPVAKLLRNKRTGEILRTLNTNVETPTRIWNVGMRNDLFKFLDKMEEDHPEDEMLSVVKELQGVSTFGYGALKDELRIGGVYIRIFNRMGLENGALRDIDNPGAFAKRIADFIARSLNECEQFPDNWTKLSVSEPQPIADEWIEEESMLNHVPVTDARFLRTLIAFRILVRVDGLIDDFLCDTSNDAPSILLSLLELPQNSEAFEIGCDILSLISPQQKFADAVAQQGALWRLLWVLERSDSQADAEQADILRKQRGWALMESLSSSPSIASKLCESTAWLELLGILVGYSSFTKVWIARTGAAKTLSRLLWDPKTGPVLAPLLQRFLPTTLVVILKEEGPDTMLNCFDGESDTPELIWNSTMRAELRKVMAEQLDACIERRQTTGTGDDSFILGAATCVKYKELEDELFVGGVYVSRFLKEPTHNLRDPTAFLEMLLQRWTHELKLFTSQEEQKSEDASSTALAVGTKDALQSVTDASIYLCKIRSNLCEKLAQWGYMSRCLAFLDDILRQELFGTPLLSVMRLIHVAVSQRKNVEALIISSQNDRLHGIITFTKQAVGSESLHPNTALMIDMLKRLFLDVLGDLKSVENLQMHDMKTASAQHYNHGTMMSQNYAMAPSPAPGEGPVSRNRVSMGNPLDDPLALTSAPASNPTTTQTPSSYGTPNFASPMVQNQANFASVPTQNHSNFGRNNQAMYQPQTSMMYAPQSVGVNASTFGQRVGNQASFPGPTNSGYAVPSAPAPSNSTQYPYHSSFPVTNAVGAQGYQQTPLNATYQPHPSIPQPVANPLQTTPPTIAPNMYMQQQSSVAQNQYGITGQTPIQQQRALPQPQTSAPRNLPQTSGYATLQQPMAAVKPQQQVSGTSYSQMMAASARNAGHPILAKPQTFSMQTQQPTTTTPPMTAGLPIQQQTTFVRASQGDAGMQNAQVRMPNQPQVLGVQPVHTQEATRTQPQTVTSQPASNQYGHLSQTTIHEVPIPQTVSNGSTQVTTVQESTSTSRELEGSSAQSNEGSSIDARTQMDPKEEAEVKIKIIPGAPGSADGRVPLLQSALTCDLPKFLVEDVLENPTLANVKDPSGTKVHAVELLKLLSSDPGYGMKFEIILDEIPSWKKYKSQDHSLFITSSEQKMADYFLTDGTDSRNPTKLLTQE